LEITSLDWDKKRSESRGYLRLGTKYFLRIIGPARNEGELRRLAMEAVTHFLGLSVRARSKNT
jgi:hypothetical protein